MSSWKDINARRDAVKAFVKHLLKPGNEKIRAKATDPEQRAFAKELFADKGGFEIEGSATDETKIPKNMEFRVYEQKEIPRRDQDLGVMVLPTKLSGEPNVSTVWRCTWEDWTSLKVRKKSPARFRVRNVVVDPLKSWDS